MARGLGPVSNEDPPPDQNGVGELGGERYVIGRTRWLIIRKAKKKGRVATWAIMQFKYPPPPKKEVRGDYRCKFQYIFRGRQWCGY